VTIEASPQSVGVVEFRDKIRLWMERVEQGEPVIVFQHGEPAAVVLAHAETERWWGIERSLSAFHGLELYPELARDTSELAALIRGDVRPSHSAVRELSRRPRSILASPRFVGVAAFREEVAAVLETIKERPIVIYSRGDWGPIAIHPDEYDRLRALSRSVAWFRSAGLDLAIAREEEVAKFVRAFRAAPIAAEVEPAARAG
jgi:prevent-host-death family protein